MIRRREGEKREGGKERRGTRGKTQVTKEKKGKKIERSWGGMERGREGGMVREWRGWMKKRKTPGREKRKDEEDKNGVRR